MVPTHHTRIEVRERNNNDLFEKELSMNMSHLSTNLLTHTAIIALKNAYDDCTDKSAKESIITAFKAVIQLRQDLGKFNNNDGMTDNESDYDASEFCAAV
jgi:hypothetical protein